MHRVITNHPEAEYILHLGDGNNEFENLMSLFPEKKYVMVCGNNDFYSQAQNDEVVKIGGVTVFMTHGHRYGVYVSLDRLKRAAAKYDARVILYGHTHMTDYRYEQGVYIMNPGSISQPRMSRKSYGFIDITGGSVFCGISEL